MSQETDSPPCPGPGRWDAIVIGAGAAGMMCAAQIGQRGRRVLLIDHAAKLGEKIRISGGGRCNFTNLHCLPANFISHNPAFCRSALARYTPQDFIALIERHGIAYEHKTLGQLFCRDSARQIIAMLKEECQRGDVSWWMPCQVSRVGRAGNDFSVDTDRGTAVATSLVIATGGLAAPKVGATPFGYRIAEQFGLKVVPPAPALVPLAFDPETMARYGELSGVSIEAEVSCNGQRFRENLLLTHRGLSGPAILQISSYWRGGDTIEIDLLPGVDIEARLRAAADSRVQLDNWLAQFLPRRLSQRWCEAHGLAKPLNEFSSDELREVAIGLHRWRVRPSGTLGYNKAEVTLGGVDTACLSSKTMEARAVPGLFFVGEVVDVTGHLGGYNFQWAWASGHAAGQVA